MLSRRIVQALVALWMLTYTGVFSQMCSSIKNFKHVREATVITGSTFRTIKDVGLVGCSKQCLLRSDCQSFNYEPRTKECQLNKNSSSNTESGNVKTVVGSLSSDIENWPSKLAGVCSSRSCSANSVCVERTPYMACKIECPNPTLQNGSFTSNISHNVEDEVKFTCDVGFSAMGIAKCKGDGTWGLFKCIQGCVNPPNVLNAELITSGDDWPTGTTLEYKCKSSLDKVGDVSCLSEGTWTEMKCVARNCASLLHCNNTYSDEEYWLYPEVLHDNPVKIYCHDMTTGNPLEYLTMPEENYVDYSDVSCDPFGLLSNCESTRFFKVRITDLYELSTRGFSDLNFVNTSTECSRVKFAIPFDCKGQCYEGHSTDFVINTKGTGLIVNPSQEWSPPPTDKELTIETSDSGRYIKMKCMMRCGSCFPLYLKLDFVLDESQPFNISSAILPSC